MIGFVIVAAKNITGAGLALTWRWDVLSGNNETLITHDYSQQKQTHNDFTGTHLNSHNGPAVTTLC